MAKIDAAVGTFMTSPVWVVDEDARLPALDRRLTELGVSAVAVVDRTDRVVGLASRADLLRVGKRSSGAAGRRLLELPDRPVSDVMSRDLAIVPPEAPIGDAAGLMLSHGIHRVLVRSEDGVIGILTTRDIMRAIAVARLREPVRKLMVTPILTTAVDEPASVAIERLAEHGVSGLVVLDEGWPVGVFGEIEALDARAYDSDVDVEAVMTPSLVAVDPSTPLHRAAAQAASMDVRMIVVAERLALLGVLSGLDFARLAS